MIMKNIASPDDVCSRCGKKLIHPFYVTECRSATDAGTFVCSECCDEPLKSMIYAAAGVPEVLQ
jgi:hypothetical protein